MKRVLSIQSHVVSGYVGNKVAVFTLEVCGFNVDPINTVQFSNHTGYPIFKGEVLKPEMMLSIYQGLTENNLNNYDYLLTGYMNNPQTLKAIMTIVKDLKNKNPNLIYVCDPVMGDDGKLYPSVPMEMVEMYKNEVLCHANFLLPNQTECELLTGIKINSIEDAERAADALHQYGIRTVIITSIILETFPNKIYIYVSQDNNKFTFNVDRIPISYHGTGDLFASLILSWSLKVDNIFTAIEKTLSTIYIILHDTENSPNNELQLIRNRDTIINPPEVEIISNSLNIISK